MNPVMQMYEFHKREFGVEDDMFLQLFEGLLSHSPGSAFECAPKITPQGIHAGRLRLGYEQKDNQRALDDICRFLDRIGRCEGVNLNHEILNRFLNKGLDLSRIMKMGIGIDSRKNIYDSKVKYYIMIRKYPEKVEEVLSIHPPIKAIEDYPVDDIFGFGVNLYFDGRTDTEIYPLFTTGDLKDTALMHRLKLQDIVNRFANQCNALHISFESGGKRILHFHPQSPTRFVHLIGNRQLSELYSSVQILNYLLGQSHRTEPLRVSISLLEDEMISENMLNINLQYTLACRPPTTIESMPPQDRSP